MMLANAIPLYMDWFWPFERNVPVVVAGVQVEEIAEAEQVEGSQLKEVA